jgi:DNA-binding MarR family transcriptional regulator
MWIWSEGSAPGGADGSEAYARPKFSDARGDMVLRHPPRTVMTSSPKAGKRYEPPEHAIWLLKRAWQNGHRTVNEAVRSYGVTSTQLGALNRLVLEPGLSGAQLARRLLVTPQAAQLALRALEQGGLVKRTPDPNHGRIVRTYLTAEGGRVARVCMTRSLEAEDQFLAALDAKDRSRLIDILGRLARPAPAGSERPNGLEDDV